MVEHDFTHTIRQILTEHFGVFGSELFRSSYLIQYLNLKTRSANRGSKSRGSFANLYALYVLIEDYFSRDYHIAGTYVEYEGALFTYLLRRQREFPFGSKLQNHALNHRMNEEFKKFFPTSQSIPIIRDVKTNRYWINENLLVITIGEHTFNLAKATLDIIDAYVKTKIGAFERFIESCRAIQTLQEQESLVTKKFIADLLAPNMDARIFEIVSYAILKYYYFNQTIYFGFNLEQLNSDNLRLYKTGRTNANDGGIDFVMKPLGRFFQVTETLDVRKYFLDIDKIEKYPLTFVIKSNEDISLIKSKLEEGAIQQYPVKAIIVKYMQSIEEIINIPILLARFEEVIAQGYLTQILGEIINQSKVEFNYKEITDDEKAIED